ncbi:MAG: hypothetical protein ABFD15_06095 [Methanofastidiosum sp.]
MNLSDEQQNELNQTNKLMAKSDYHKCPKCKEIQHKGYCGKCDSYKYSCTHKPKCTMKDWGNVNCCEDKDDGIPYAQWLHQQRKW